MANRFIAMTLASILAVATASLGAEKTPAKAPKEPTKTVAKTAEKESASGKAKTKTSKEQGIDSSGSRLTEKSTGKVAFKVRLPRGYGKLKLTADQRSDVLAIQQDYRERIHKLLAQIDKLEMSRDAEFQKVLDKSQRDLLREMTAKVATKKK